MICKSSLIKIYLRVFIKSTFLKNWSNWQDESLSHSSQQEKQNYAKDKPMQTTGPALQFCYFNFWKQSVFPQFLVGQACSESGIPCERITLVSLTGTSPVILFFIFYFFFFIRVIFIWIITNLFNTDSTYHINIFRRALKFLNLLQWHNFSFYYYSVNNNWKRNFFWWVKYTVLCSRLQMINKETQQLSTLHSHLQLKQWEF